MLCQMHFHPSAANQSIHIQCVLTYFPLHLIEHAPARELRSTVVCLYCFSVRAVSSINTHQRISMLIDFHGVVLR